MQSTFAQWLARKPAGPKPKKPVKKVSAKRRRESYQYRWKRKRFLKLHPLCQAWLTIRFHHPADLGTHLASTAHPASTEVHHRCGRYEGNYLNEETWIAVCRWSHRWIHDHPKEARALGLLL